MRLFLLLIALFIVTSNSVHAQIESPEKVEVDITYIANSGFLIQVNDKKVLVDALFKDIESEYYDSPSKQLTQKIINGESPFEGINLIASTHEHVDNFDNNITAAVLASHSEAKFVSCAKTVEQVENTSQYQQIRNQLVEITPEQLTHVDTTINGIDVRVYRINHGPYYIEDPLTGRKTDIYRFAEHLGFRFTIDGVSFFHCGDSNSNALDEYHRLRLDNENLDFAFLGRGFLYQPQGQGVAIMKKYIQAKHYIIMQIQHEDNEYYKEVADAVKPGIPSVKVFEREMETKTYEIDLKPQMLSNQ